MEYLEGPTLFQYLESGGILSEKLMSQILFVLKEMKRLKFTRLDADLRHIIVTKEEELKVIDHYSSFNTGLKQTRVDIQRPKKVRSITNVLGRIKRNGSRILYRMGKFLIKKSNSFKANKSYFFL